MYTFLVLGLIPGTNIQINFYAWIIIMIGLGISAYRLRPRVVRYLSNWWHQFDEAEPRQPLHANQLHLRGL
ncbi:MAG TPA: hypothetical protein VHC21_04790 [Candidatus Saccharimonadales bacterium]|nr:hypothetical protein [Candidatus Saccharimonadales bacterium]